MNKNWTQELVPGDRVIISSTGCFGREHVDWVERITKTQIVLKSSKVKYRRSDGWAVGRSGYYSSFLKQATEEAVEEILHERRARSISNALHKEAAVIKLSKESVQQIYNILEEECSELLY